MSETEEIVKLYDEYVMTTYSPQLMLVRGKGTKVWDSDGKVYLDFIAGISVLNVGYSHPRVVEAICRQAGELMHVSNLYYNENQARLAERLAGLSLRGKCFFCNSGAEANEGLFKTARLWGHDEGRYEIICMKNSFHGRTLAAAAATGQEKVRKGFEPMPEGFCHAEFNDLDSVTSLVTDKTVAVMLEAVQGEGGIVPASEPFMKGVRDLCDEKNLLMLCDEVQCGMGRTGNWFAFQGYDVEPDGFSSAKALASGFPIGAVVAGPKAAGVFKPGTHASTFGGTPLACAAALATLDVIEEEDLVARAKQAGETLSKGLAAFAEKYEHVVEARGLGLMVGMVLDEPAKPFVQRLADEGLLALATAENVVRFLPPLNVKDSEIEEALEILDDCLAEWHGVAVEPEDGEPEAAEPQAGAEAEDAAAEPAAGEEPVEAVAQEPASDPPSEQQADDTATEDTDTVLLPPEDLADGPSEAEEEPKPGASSEG
ncbi:aspartate aminotransferase family protein [Verrucomicrobiota bacterium]